MSAIVNTNADRPLWTPQAPHETPTIQLLHKLNEKYALDPPLATYEDLWRFSTTRIADFWDTVWDEVEVVGDKGVGAGPGTDGKDRVHVVDELKTPADNPEWFKDAKLNWTENMLLKKWRGDDRRVAFVQVGKP